MHKKILLASCAFLFSFYLLNAQSGFGLKGSFIYNSNGKLFNEAGNIYENNGAGESGFNIGFYGKLNLPIIYIRPEVVFTMASSSYTIDSEEVQFKQSSIDVPVLLGIKIIKPLSLYFGPAFQFILNNDFEGLDEVATENNTTVGVNAGIALAFGSVGIDLRYNRAISSNEANFIDNIADAPSYTLDTRPQQIILGLSYRLSKKKK